MLKSGSDQGVIHSKRETSFSNNSTSIYQYCKYSLGQRVHLPENTMPSKAQILQIDPANELIFNGPFTSQVVVPLKLTNPSTRHPVCFKIKTTVPRRYVVRPNGGVLGAGKEQAVSIMLQPFEYDPSDKTRHKFMVQSVEVVDGGVDAAGSDVDIERVWSRAKPEDVMDSKLRCTFVMPDSAADAGVTTTGGSSRGSMSPTGVATPPSTAAAGPDDLQMQVKRLQDRNAQLKSENAGLLRKRREEEAGADVGLRHRRAPHGAAAVGENPGGGGVGGLFQVRPGQALPLPPIVFIIAAVVIGLVIGKYIL